MSDSTAPNELRSFVERIERIEEEIRAGNDDKRDVYAEAKGRGYDVKVLKRVIAHRRKDANEVAEQDAIFDLYLDALTRAGARAHEEA